MESISPDRVTIVDLDHDCASIPRHAEIHGIAHRAIGEALHSLSDHIRVGQDQRIIGIVPQPDDIAAQDITAMFGKQFQRF